VAGREDSIEEGLDKSQEEKKERTIVQDASLLLFCGGKQAFSNTLDKQDIVAVIFRERLEVPSCFVQLVERKVFFGMEHIKYWHSD